MKLEVKYLFPTSSSGANFYIYKLYEGLGMIAHGIRMQNNHGFSWIFIDLCGSKVQLAPLHKNFINGVANSEIVH